VRKENVEGERTAQHRDFVCVCVCVWSSRIAVAVACLSALTCDQVTVSIATKGGQGVHGYR
jgi:hypothetical protein